MHEMESKVHTICVYCGCGCGMYLHIKNNKIARVAPSPSHPLSRGKLCVKGWFGWEFVSHPDRLKFPLIRRNDRLVRASWDEALNILAKNLLQLRITDPKSIGVLTSAKGTNEENYLLMKLARAGLKTNNVDNVARLCHASTVVGLGYALGSGATTNSIKSLTQADVILVAGSNTTDQHPLVVPYIQEAMSKGAKLIVVDPRKTRIAKLADIHLSPKLGTDIVWINAMLNIIIQEGLIDEEFISRRTTGFEAVQHAVDKYTPEMVERLSGIPAEDLKAAAMTYGSADRGSILYAMGITQHARGTDSVQALANLALATGNIGKDGTGLYPLRGHQNVQGACDVGALPNVFSGYQSVVDFRQKFEKAWSTDLPTDPGLTAMEMLTAAEQGKLKGLFIIGENPMLSYPDISRVRRALQTLEFLAVSDIFFTETAELADVVLPACCFAEKDGTFTSTERRIQRINKAVDPPGEARSEWEMISDLLRRLGIPANYTTPAEIMEEIASLTPIYGGVRYDRLGINGLQWPCPDILHPGTEILHTETFPIGLARFRPVEYIASSKSTNEEYPMLLTTGRHGYYFHTNTMTGRTSLAEMDIQGPFVEINVEDAELLSIGNGEMAIVESAQGQLYLKARVTEDIPKGMIFIPFHFYDAPANFLTSQILDQVSKTPELKVTPARLRKPDYEP